MPKKPTVLEPLNDGKDDFNDAMSKIVVGKNSEISSIVLKEEVVPLPGELFPVIGHEEKGVTIDQRAYDGYINATELCKASNKEIKHYLENKNTKDFLHALSRSVGIPTDLLVQKINTGKNEFRDTWVHPQVAINLGQWVNPEFAVLVSKWVFEWMQGTIQATYELPLHVRRYIVNRHKIPPTHFSMLDQMTLKLLAPLESKGYLIPDKLMPDISLGRMFSKWCREHGRDPNDFPTYKHVFADGKRKDVDARLYPNDLMTSFNLELNNWITKGKALTYFKERDSSSIEPLKLVTEEIKNI